MRKKLAFVLGSVALVLLGVGWAFAPTTITPLALSERLQ